MTDQPGIKGPWSLIKKIGTIITVSTAIIGLIWTGAPYIAKTQVIYQNIEELLHLNDDVHNMLQLVTATVRANDLLSVEVLKISGQNRQLLEEIEELEHSIQDVIVGSWPYDSLYHRGEFGEWTIIHARDYKLHD